MVCPKMSLASLATAEIYCTTSLPLSRAMEDCSIVQVQQLQMLYRRRYSIHITTYNKVYYGQRKDGHIYIYFAYNACSARL